MANEQIEWPKKTRELQNPSVDSTRWDGFKFRDDDIVIAGHPKSGTTLTLQIASQLVLGAPDRLMAGGDVPWPEWQPMIPIATAMNAAEAITHRRLLTTHLPLDTLVFSPKAKYIYVARDPRDVVWSAYNHLIAFPDIVWTSGYPGRRPEGDERDHYLDFLAGKCAPMPTYGDYWEHIASWWAIRSLPNVLFVHYANLKADLAGEIRRIARFVELPLDEALLPKIVSHCSLDHMRALALQEAAAAPDGGKFVSRFYNKGTNGRWRDVLSTEEIARCDEIAAEKLGPECVHWLKTGDLPA